MKWLKLESGALFNLECVSYILVDAPADIFVMNTMDGRDEWHDETIRQVWDALQPPQTIVPSWTEPYIATMIGIAHKSCP